MPRGGTSAKTVPFSGEGKEEGVRTKKKKTAMMALAAVVLVALVVGGGGTALAQTIGG